MNSWGDNVFSTDIAKKVSLSICAAAVGDTTKGHTDLLLPTFYVCIFIAS